MKLLTVRSLWGYEGHDIRATLASVKKEGFDAVEASLPDLGPDHAAFAAALSDAGLGLVGMPHPSPGHGTS
eukprot:gene6684-6403_t